MLSKGERSKAKMIEALLRTLASEGVEGTTFQSVADQAGVSQALVVKTFKNRENLIWTALEFIINEAKTLTAARLTNELSASTKLLQYIQVSLEIFRSRPETSRIYVLMYYLATHDSRYLEFNTKIKEFAVQRVQTILREGIATGEFRADINVALQAKLLHSSLTGVILNSATEISGYDVAELGQTLWENAATQIERNGKVV